MTIPRRFDRAPRPEFADQLERNLLRALDLSSGATTRVNEERPVMIDVQHSAPVETPRRNRLSVAIAAAAVLIAGIAWAVGRIDRSTHDPAAPPAITVSPGQPVTFTVRWSPRSNMTSRCQGAENACLYSNSLFSSARLAGDVTGNGTIADVGNHPADQAGNPVGFTPDPYHDEEVTVYNVLGSIAGCGSGEFLLVEIVQFVNGGAAIGDYTGTWQIVPDSGRGELKSVNGRGTMTGTYNRAVVRRTLTGVVSCS